MLTRRRIHVLTALMLLAALAARADGQQAPSRLTLDEAVAAALQNNQTLRAKTLEFQSVKANEITAGLRPNPVASYAAEQLGARSVDPQHTVTLGQPIETGGKRSRRVDSARAATAVTAQEVEDTRRQVVLQVKKAFTDALVARATLALAEENLKTVDEVERLQRFRAERGDISELELLRLQLQRLAFERDAADARQAGEVARIALRAAIGTTTVPDTVEIVGELAVREVAADAAALRQRALQARPDLRAAAAGEAKARADVSLARANAWWDFTPQLEYQRIGSDNTIGVGISVPLRIFDRNQGEIARARAEVARTAALRQALADQIVAEVDTALAAVVVQRARLAAIRDTHLPRAAQARDTVEFAYRRGGMSLLDFLDAQRTYREAALEHLRSLGNLRSAIDQLEAAVGGALEE